MKEFKITEEQIKIIYEATSVNNQEQLREWFKEVFETKLEVDKWYVIENIKKGSLGFCGIGMFTHENHESGLLDFESGFNFQAPNGIIWRVNGDIRLATEQEVFDALKKEAEKRGYKKGVSFISVANKIKTTLDKDIEYDIKFNCLFVGKRDFTGVIFENGIWAEIIEQTEEIIELNGVKYKRID